MIRSSIHPALWLTAAVLLTACGRESATPPAAGTGNPASEAPSTANASADASRAAMLEQQLAELGAKQTDRGLLLVLPSAQFNPGQTSFEPKDATGMERLAELLRERPELQLRVIGHSDSRGSAALNERLSRERAEAVEQALRARHQIAAERITVQGAGESEPLTSNATAEGRAQNRRVEILVTDRTGRYASSSLPSPSG